MLILTSNGLSTLELLGEVKRYVHPSDKKAAIITTASVGYKEKDKYIPKITNELCSLGLVVEYFDIELQNPELLFGYDVIEINGGNPFYLLEQLRRKDCAPIFRKLINNKIVIGISAGSVVFQTNIDLIAQYSPEMNAETRLIDFKGMGLTHVEILPHYTRFISRFERFEERAKQYEEDNQKAIIRLDDGHGVFINKDNFYVL